MTLDGRVHGDLSSLIIILSAIRRSSLPIPHSLTYSSWDQGYFYIPSYVSYLWWKEEAQANWVAEEEAKRVLEADLIEKLVETKCHRGIANKTCHPETWLQSWAWVCSSEKSNLFSWFLVADNQAVIKDISLLNWNWTWNHIFLKHFCSLLRVKKTESAAWPFFGSTAQPQWPLHVWCLCAQAPLKTFLYQYPQFLRDERNMKYLVFSCSSRMETSFLFIARFPSSPWLYHSLGPLYQWNKILKTT